MSRKKLLFLDQAFHAHSRSSDFFLDLLSQRFEVVHEYLQSPWDDAEAARKLIEPHQPDILLCWQVRLRCEILVQLGIPSIWVPMFDDVNRRLDDRFIESARVGEAMIAFSKAHADVASFWNIPVLPVCYFIPPAEPSDLSQGNNRVLLWYRGAIQPAELSPVLKDIPNLELVIKHDPDPPYATVKRDDGDLAPFVKTVIEGFLPKEEYNALVASCGVFVAPRKSEGIGLSFLEAMARGSAVIGYDAPTMNEYLTHGVTGWLFNETSKPALPASQIPFLRAAAYEASLAGAIAWDGSETAILDFIEAAPKPSYSANTSPLKVRAVRLLKRLKPS